MEMPKWPNKQAGEHTSELEEILKEIHEHNKGRAKDIINLAQNVTVLKDMLDNFLKGTQVDLITVPVNYSDTFNAGGYRLNSLFVSDTVATAGAKLVISYYGVTYTKALNAGENDIDIPNGATYTAVNDAGDLAPFSAMLTRCNFRS